jgi:hypothetical protein
MPILGLRHTDNFATNERPQNWREGILRIYPTSAKAAEAPLTALTAVMKTRKISDPVFHWWEKALNNRRFLVTVALGVTAAGAAGTLTVDASYNAATGIKKNDVLMIEATGEIIRASADATATTTVPILRGVNTGGSGLAMNPATAGTNPYAIIIGSAFEEGSDAPTGVNFDPQERFNQTQIFRSTLEMTRTAAQTDLRTVDQVNEAKRECLEYFSVDMERGFWFGKKGTGTVNGKPHRMMSGVIEQLQSAAGANVITADAAAGVDADWLMALLRTIFKQGSSEKMAFAGGGALLTFNEIIRKNSTVNWDMTPATKEYGMSVTRFTSPFGTLVLKVHPLFSQIEGGSNGGTAFYGHDATMAILDMDFVRYVYMQDVKYQSDLTPIGLDGQKSGYLAEVSLELSHPSAHFLIKNLAKAKKDA